MSQSFRAVIFDLDALTDIECDGHRMAYNAAFASFLKRLADDGITPQNTEFVWSRADPPSAKAPSSPAESSACRPCT